MIVAIKTLSFFLCFLFLTSCFSWLSDDSLARRKMWLKDCEGAAKAFSYLKEMNAEQRAFGMLSAKKCLSKSPEASLLFYETLSLLEKDEKKIIALQKTRGEIAFYKLKNYPLAKSIYNKLSQMNVHSFDLVSFKYMLAQILFKEKKYKESLELVEILLKKKQTARQTDKLLILKAGLLFNLNSNELAKQFYKEQISKSSNKDFYIKYLVLTYEEEEDFSKALQVLEGMTNNSFKKTKQKQLLRGLRNKPLSGNK